MTVDWRWVWNQIALEHVNDQLETLEKGIRKTIQQDPDLLAFRQCHDRIPSIQLCSILQERASGWVGDAYQVYCAIWQQQRREKSRDFCIAVFQLGLLPFIRNKVLNLICFALATAQPALKMNPDRQYSYDSEEFRPGTRLAGVRRILDYLQNHWGCHVMSEDAPHDPATSLSAIPINTSIRVDYVELIARGREAQSIWDQIAHERIKEQLGRVSFRTSLDGLFPSPRGDAHRAYSEQASKLRNSTSKIPSRELEEAVFRLEDISIQAAFDIYQGEIPQKEIMNTTLLWLVYNLGLVPFIETKILWNTCFKLDEGQPSLGLNLLRADPERFFSYNSQKLRKEFPVVIRIVDRLKAQWRDKIAARVREMTAGESPASLATAPSAEEHTAEQTIGEVSNAGKDHTATTAVEFADEATDKVTELSTAESDQFEPKSRPEAETELRRGRPRLDILAQRVEELKNSGRSWGEIKIQLDREIGEQRTVGAYRGLYTSRRKIE